MSLHTLAEFLKYWPVLGGKKTDCAENLSYLGMGSSEAIYYHTAVFALLNLQVPLKKTKNIFPSGPFRSLDHI